MKFATIFISLLIAIPSFAQNEYPVINNLSVQIDAASQMVTVNYDLFDEENEAMQLTFLVSDNDGQSFIIDTDNATGDVGFPIQSGNNKIITWDASGLLTGPGDYQVKLVADDLFEIDIQTIVDQVDSNRLLTHLQYIEGPRHRNTNPVQLEAVKDSIEQYFITAGLDTKRLDFPYSNYTGQNIVGRLEGTTQSEVTYIVDAHFDTVSSSPGADDNGSGVVGMLEALRVLSPYKFGKTLKFIGFDLEEEGLLGAFDYTSNELSTEETIEGVFNMEMIGYYSDEPNSQSFPAGLEILYPDQYATTEADEFRGNFITNIGDGNSVALQMAYDDAAVQYVPGLKTISFIAPDAWQVFTPDFGRSDHAPFWIEGIPALMLTDGSNFRNPNYHTSNDTVESLNFTFMSNVVKAVVGAVAEEADIQHSTMAFAEFSVLVGLDNTLKCNLQISPIPTDKNLNLKFKQCDYEVLNIQVFNVLGKLILDKKVDSRFNCTIDFDAVNMEAGIYVLKVSNGAQALSRKIVVH